MSLVSLAFDTGARRQPTGWVGQLIYWFAALTAVWVIWAAGFSRTDSLSLTITFLTLMLVMTFALIAPFANSAGHRVPWPDWVLILASAGAGIFFIQQSDSIAERITLLDPLSRADVIAATALICLTIEAMRRTVGLGLTVLVLIFIAYNLYGDLLGGPMGHGEITGEHFLDIMVFTTDGLFGVPLRVAATYAFLFVLFGTALSKTGGADFFFDLAAAISGKSPGGPAKIAVISSGLYGTISGSPTSDVVTTGAVTIPMMKRLGYSSSFAGAVEVAASTGGSLLPPVMGAAAFIMAEYTGIRYVDIAMAALIPALLYYLPIYWVVHLRAERYQLAALDQGNSRSLWQTLRSGGLFIAPLIAITWALLDGYTPTYAALYGLLAVLVVSVLRKQTRIGPKAIMDILADTSVRMVAVAGACAAAGLVIGGITMTGLASKLGHVVFLLAGTNAFVSLLIAAAMTVVLGMGMPTPSAYILAAVLIAPVMKGLGIDLMAAHLFLLYFAVMSALTPPVAVAAYAASAIAEESPLRIALGAVRMALPAFLIPFAFVYSPGLLLQGSVVDIAWATFHVFVGLTAIVAAVEGYFLGLLNPVVRIALALGGLLALGPSLSVILPGLIIIAIIAVNARRARSEVRHKASSVPGTK
ncbi:MAG: TRAP transporter fused permease subunit [Burkholderiaceae bacterium]